MFLRQVQGMTILYCFYVYPLPRGLRELESLELGYFELEVLVGLEGLFELSLELGYLELEVLVGLEGLFELSLELGYLELEVLVGLEGLFELDLEPGYFELEVRVGLEGLLLEYFELELECFELECFELWCFELECLWLELGGLGGFLCPPLGGHSSRGSLIFEHLLTPGNSLTLRLDLSRLRPLVAMSN